MPLAQRLLPHRGCAVRPVGYALSRRHSGRGLGFDCGPGRAAAASPAPRSFAPAASLHPSAHGPGCRGRAAPPATAAVARGEGGDRAGEAGRGEGKRTNGEGAARSPAG